MRYLLLILAFTTLSAQAQEYGVEVGVHQTTAATPVQGVKVNGVLNFDLGLAMAFELMPSLRFKTGAMYNQRNVDYHFDFVNQTITYKFAYIDVPINAQYNFTPMFGIFGGLVVGINVSDKIKLPAGEDSYDPDAKSLYPLIDVGANFLFSDMVGFDFYYERGLGNYARNVKDLSSFGLRFTYWF